MGLHLKFHYEAFYFHHLFSNILQYHMIYITPTSSKEFFDIQATIECGFTLKRIRNMIRTYIQTHRTDKFSQHSSIIWVVWLNG